MSETAGARPAAVVIVGGGYTGATVAWNLARQAAADDLPVLVVEPRPVLGAGLAYSTAEPSHRINVPAGRMSISTADPEAFQRWLDARTVPDADEVAAGARYPARALFGAFVAGQLQPLLDAGRVRHIAARAVAATPAGRGEGFTLRLDDGREIAAGTLVLATSHPAPAVPAPLQGLAGQPGFFADPTAAGIADAIPPAARVLIVGTGLTMADMVAALDGRGHSAEIVALSRHGLRSRGHAPAGPGPFGDFATRPARQVSDLLRNVRAAVRQAAAAGLPWQVVLDRVRTDGPAIWQALPPDGRRRLVRHLRTFWDVHRFRIAPQIEAVLDRRAAAGLFAVQAAHLTGAEAVAGGGFVVRRRLRGSTQTAEERFDAVVVATGPAHGDIIHRNPVVASLAAQGLVGLDPTGLGLTTSPDARAIGRDGQVRDDLFIAGPLARGTFGELMGLPDVTAYAEKVAGDVIRRLEKIPAIA